MTEPLRIAYCTPGLGPCGGIRVLIEHCNRLAAKGHDVALVSPVKERVRWIEVKVPVVSLALVRSARPFDAVVATEHQTVEWALGIPGRRKFYFVQMMEHLFFREGSNGYLRAWKSYQVAKDAGFRFITIARWLRESLRSRWGIKSIIVPNGVNREHFHPDNGKAEAILVEGDARNAAKDVEHISWRVAVRLREEFGVKLWGYAALPNDYMAEFDEFVLRPTTTQMRQMYSGALFLLKASKYEGRACAPVEAMACGTTCARAIIKGDDDLHNGKNCLRTAYDYDELLEAGRRLLSDRDLLKHLSWNALRYADTRLRWSSVIDRLEKIYAGG